MPTVSVVIASFNTKDKLRRCLSAIEQEHEAIVVDNASSDGSAEMVETEFAEAKLIRNDRNIGFGAANNLGSAVAGGEMVLFLNSDCYPAPGSIAKLAQAFEDRSVAAAGGKLLNPDGSLQQSSANRLTLWAVFCEQFYLEKLFPRTSLFSPYWNSAKLSAISQVEQVMGACLMVRKGMESFDERFFLYCEDTELCKRLRKHGKILYIPEAPFTHELGSSSSNLRWTAVAYYNRGKELYFNFHHGSIASFACFVLNRFGALFRMIFWSLATVATVGMFGQTQKYSERVGLFFRVLIAPLSGPKQPARNAL